MNKESAKELATLITGWLTALMGFLATLNIKYEWLTEASINALGVFIVATIILVVSSYAIYKNSFVITDKAKKQKEELKRRGLK